MSDESRHLWLGIPQKRHSVPKELEERIGIVIISDSQGHPGIIHIQGGWFLRRILKGPPLGSRVRRQERSLPK